MSLPSRPTIVGTWPFSSRAVEVAGDTLRRGSDICSALVAGVNGTPIPPKTFPTLELLLP